MKHSAFNKSSQFKLYMRIDLDLSHMKYSVYSNTSKLIRKSGPYREVTDARFQLAGRELWLK